MSDDDEDRAAILHRRQRFIFLALSGLTGAAGCEEPAHPAGLPEVVREQPMEPAMAPIDDAPDEAAAGEGELAAAEEPYVVDPAEVRHAEEAKRRAQRPHACLSVRPQVCLTRLPARTQEILCLWMKPDPDEDV